MYLHALYYLRYGKCNDLNVNSVSFNYLSIVIDSFVELGPLGEEFRPDTLLILEESYVLSLHKFCEANQIFVVWGDFRIVGSENLFVAGVQKVELVFYSFPLFLGAVHCGLKGLSHCDGVVSCKLG